MSHTNCFPVEGNCACAAPSAAARVLPIGYIAHPHPLYVYTHAYIHTQCVSIFDLFVFLVLIQESLPREGCTCNNNIVLIFRTAWHFFITFVVLSFSPGLGVLEAADVTEALR